MSHTVDGSHDSHTQPEVKAIGRIGDWPLDPDITFLNHGSFGSSPKAVLEEQLRLRTELEAQPIEFLVRQLEGRLDEAKAHLATFLKAHPSNLSFIPNATHGVNTVLRSLRFQPGDELLTTNHAYNACTNALRFVAEQFQAVVRVVQIPTPLDDPMEVCEHLQNAVTPKTRLLLIDHVTSPTALIFPIQEIVTQMKRQGILCLVDGAHAPGMGAPPSIGAWCRFLYRQLSQVAVCSKGCGLPQCQPRPQRAYSPAFHQPWSQRLQNRSQPP